MAVEDEKPSVAVTVVDKAELPEPPEGLDWADPRLSKAFQMMLPGGQEARLMAVERNDVETSNVSELYGLRSFTLGILQASVLAPQLLLHTVLHPRSSALVHGWRVVNW